MAAYFKAGYKVKEVISDDGFSRILNYIHQNPLSAGLVEKIDDYKYSSYQAYLSDQPTIVSKEEMIECFDLRSRLTS